MLLLHGLGSSLLAWNSLVPSLTAHHEVFALDLRGHGRSSAATWTWNSAIADLVAVFAHFRIDEAQLVGHSLGGMLAVVYASRRPRITSLVNIDGRTSSDVALFRGLDPDWTREKLAAIRLVQERQSARQLSSEEVAAFASAAQSRARENGESAEMARDAIFRCLEQLPNGAYRLRPGPSEISSFLDALDEINLVELYPHLSCRCLVVCGTEAPHAPPELPWLTQLWLEGPQPATRPMGPRWGSAPATG